ncbi:MAG: GNAT family N-acetyltransferase [Anaerolineales bacterium]
MQDIQIVEFDEHRQPNWYAVIREGLTAFNREQVGNRDLQLLRLAALDADGQVIGGVLAEQIWGWLLIGVLWVAPSWRGHGIGAALLQQAEALAQVQGCRHCALETFSFQARAFYERQGYVVYGALEDFPPGHVRYSMKKDF